MTLEEMIALLTKLSVVTVTFEPEDNPCLKIIALLRAGQAMREANRDGSTAARMCASEAWDAALGEKE